MSLPDRFIESMTTILYSYAFNNISAGVVSLYMYFFPLKF
jgi:hypothetical protein